MALVSLKDWSEDLDRHGANRDGHSQGHSTGPRRTKTPPHKPRLLHQQAAPSSKRSTRTCWMLKTDLNDFVYEFLNHQFLTVSTFFLKNCWEFDAVEAFLHKVFNHDRPKQLLNVRKWRSWHPTLPPVRLLSFFSLFFTPWRSELRRELRAVTELANLIS